MFPELTLKIRNYAASMGSGFVVIAGFLLAITMVFVIVFARYNGMKNSASYMSNNDKPRIESTIDDSGCVSLVIPDLQ
ncbi:MAG: hypothetical protein SPL61_10925 [Saccharofermentans sp.]|nr:hypothetical protein [Saccharofermentans sp.]MDY6340129.1 hypothetical protein [Saccharofermentans sp.]